MYIIGLFVVYTIISFIQLWVIFLLAQKDKKIKTIDPDARSCFCVWVLDIDWLVGLCKLQMESEMKAIYLSYSGMFNTKTLYTTRWRSVISLVHGLWSSVLGQYSTLNTIHPLYNFLNRNLIVSSLKTFNKLTKGTKKRFPMFSHTKWIVFVNINKCRFWLLRLSKEVGTEGMFSTVTVL